jgi:hypothetical protein
MFNLSNTNYCERLNLSIKDSLYEAVKDTSTKTYWIRLAAMPLGITVGLLTIATRVACFVEDFIKGLVNIFGCLFTDKCNFKKGVQQLFMDTPWQMVLIPVSIVDAVYKIFVNTIYLSIRPTEFSEDKLEEISQIVEYNYTHTPPVVQPIGFNPDVYHVELEDSAQSEEDLFHVDFIAAEVGDVDAMYRVGKRYMDGVGTKVNRHDGLFWINEAAKNGHAEAQKEFQ